MSDSSPKKILLVEGNGTLSGMIQSGLEKSGYDVVPVDSGRDAWDAIGAGFDAVITDYEMSDSVGTKVCSGVRQHRKHKSLPMIVVCGDRTVDLPALKEELDLIAAFRKPLSVNELVAALDGFMSGGAAETPPPPENPPAAETPPTPGADEPPPSADERPPSDAGGDPPAE